jgi:hypothetical protein
MMKWKLKVCQKNVLLTSFLEERDQIEETEETEESEGTCYISINTNAQGETDEDEEEPELTDATEDTDDDDFTPPARPVKSAPTSRSRRSEAPGIWCTIKGCKASNPMAHKVTSKLYCKNHLHCEASQGCKSMENLKVSSLKTVLCPQHLLEGRTPKTFPESYSDGKLFSSNTLITVSRKR